MKNVNQNQFPHLKIIKHYIKDLSFENPQSVLAKKSEIRNSSVEVDLNLLYNSYDDQFFGVTLRYNCKSSIKTKKSNLFLLEIDYLGIFSVNNKNQFKEDVLTKEGARLIFPFARSIIANISQNGGGMPIMLDNISFDLERINL